MANPETKLRIASLLRQCKARDNEIGMLKNKVELLEEDVRCVHMWLDDLKVPREGKEGTYSIIGRFKYSRLSSEGILVNAFRRLMQKIALVHKDELDALAVRDHCADVLKEVRSGG